MEETADKKQKVRSMFNSIAAKYDFLNHFLSAGIDFSWRKQAIRMLGKYHPQTILDVATGTADLAIEAAKLHPHRITGIDIAADMLAIGHAKIAQKNLTAMISLQLGDSENLQFEDMSFDAVMVAFGVRNFANLDKGLSEMFRVLKVGGVVVILEFSKPHGFGIRQFYNLYFKFVLPVLGRIISGNKSAYTYLPESVSDFPAGEDFLRILSKAGFTNTTFRPLSLGIASLYSGTKNN
jgi:demethylmenaquinone methyltransferase / 2-methoxy-6-polyprenyl-1,4-benzoquinol methylase